VRGHVERGQGLVHGGQADVGEGEDSDQGGVPDHQRQLREVVGRVGEGGWEREVERGGGEAIRAASQITSGSSA
jgi:hypothetical protein